MNLQCENAGYSPNSLHVWAYMLYLSYQLCTDFLSVVSKWSRSPTCYTHLSRAEEKGRMQAIELKYFSSSACFSFYDNSIMFVAQNGLFISVKFGVCQRLECVEGHLYMMAGLLDLFCGYLFTFCSTVTLAVKPAADFKIRAVVNVGVSGRSGGSLWESTQWCSN